MRKRPFYLLVLGLFGTLGGCHNAPSTAAPKIEFTKLPPSGLGSPDKLFPIEGRVTGGRGNQRIVLFARSGIWWVQPTGDQPFTKIDANANWHNVTHPGSAYAALLVDSGYSAPSTLEKLPAVGGDVMALAVADGAQLTAGKTNLVQFSGYDWEIRDAASDRGGTRNLYHASNVWVDGHGCLHLRIARNGDEWSSAEVRLTRSLGYGSYRFVVRDMSRMEPAAVFSVFTWDDEGPTREMDIEISRWGEPASKNAQYVIQPYYVPANAVRFTVPQGVLTHSFQWAPGQVKFRTVQGSSQEGGKEVDEHTFTSGVPSPGNESIHINLYRFDNHAHPLQRPCEVVVEKFEYLP